MDLALPLFSALTSIDSWANYPDRQSFNLAQLLNIFRLDCIKLGLISSLQTPFKGNRGLELVEINTNGDQDGADIFRYFDIQFPHNDRDAENVSWIDVQKNISFSQANPPRCVVCHGQPARPIFPGYPQWEGAFGSKAHVNPSQKEVDGIESFQKNLISERQKSFSQNQKSNYRYNILSPYFTLRELAEANIRLNRI